MKTDELLATVMANRAFIYTLLNRVFAEEPTRDVIAVLKREHTMDEIRLAGDDNEVTSGLIGELNALDTEDAAALERLTHSYTRLFIGPRALPAPPWESVYLSGMDALFQQSTLDVRNFYRSEGYLPSGYPSVADDHLAIELSFLAALAVKTLAAYEKSDRETVQKTLTAQKRFLDEHLLVWISAFSQRLADSAQADAFYLGFAEYAACFCRSDVQTIEELLSRLV